MGMRMMKSRGALVVVTVVCLASVCVAQSREIRFFVTGSGSATGTDRQAALDDAYDKASEQARLFCAGGAGQARHVERTGSSCVELGDGENRRFSCMVFVSAECVARR